MQILQTNHEVKKNKKTSDAFLKLLISGISKVKVGSVDKKLLICFLSLFYLRVKIWHDVRKAKFVCIFSCFVDLPVFIQLHYVPDWTQTFWDSLYAYNYTVYQIGLMLCGTFCLYIIILCTRLDSCFVGLSVCT